MHDLKISRNEYVINEDTWKHAYEDCKQFFETERCWGGSWLIRECSHTGQFHYKASQKIISEEKYRVYYERSCEKDETYFVHKMNDLMDDRRALHVYEKNPCMQNYMIASRKKNGAVSPETVEDRAAQDFRDLVRKRGDRQKRRKTGRPDVCGQRLLVLVLIIMGVSMVNSFDRMKSVQSKLDALADTSGTVETRETSGSVTAVTSEEQTGDGQTEEDQSADAQETGRTKRTGRGRTEFK